MVNKMGSNILENIDRELTVCSFTGHRRLKNEEISTLTGLLDDIVEELILRGCTIFCAGGALGFDTMAALSVIKLRERHRERNIKLNLILPYPQQSAKWSQDDVITYEFIKDLASNYKYLYPEYNDTALSERNHVLVDMCDIVIGYCSTIRSGTGSTMNYAKRCGKPVVNLRDMLN